jgi:hypothetical protein
MRNYIMPFFSFGVLSKIALSEGCHAGLSAPRLQSARVGTCHAVAAALPPRSNEHKTMPAAPHSLD